MPCSISPWATARAPCRRRTRPAGRPGRCAHGPSRCRRGAACRECWCVAAGRGGDAGEGADLDDPLLEHERPGDRAKHRLGGFLGAGQLVRDRAQGDRELVAAEAGDHRVGAELVGERAGDALQQPVAGLIAVLVVDRLEAVDLERDDDEALVAARRRPRAQLRGAVGEALAVVEAGDRVGASRAPPRAAPARRASRASCWRST